MVEGGEGGFDGKSAAVDVYQEWEFGVCDFGEVEARGDFRVGRDDDVLRSDGGLGIVGGRYDGGGGHFLDAAVFVDTDNRMEIMEYLILGRFHSRKLKRVG